MDAREQERLSRNAMNVELCCCQQLTTAMVEIDLKQLNNSY